MPALVSVYAHESDVMLTNSSTVFFTDSRSTMPRTGALPILARSWLSADAPFAAAACSALARKGSFGRPSGLGAIVLDVGAWMNEKETRYNGITGWRAVDRWLRRLAAL